MKDPEQVLNASCEFTKDSGYRYGRLYRILFNEEMFFISNGVPIEIVSKMLGHRSLKHTHQYAKIVDTKIRQDMQALRRKLKLSI